MPSYGSLPYGGEAGREYCLWTIETRMSLLKQRTRLYHHVRLPIDTWVCVPSRLRLPKDLDRVALALSNDVVLVADLHLARDPVGPFTGLEVNPILRQKPSAANRRQSSIPVCSCSSWPSLVQLALCSPEQKRDHTEWHL
jgi:hypothetical protein